MTINPPPTRVPSKLQPDSESTSFMRDFTTSVYQLWATVTSTTGVFSGITDLTGDVTASGPGVASATLAVANSDVGTWGSGSLIPVITVNAKGLITAVSTATFAVVPSDISGFDAAARAAVVTDAIVDGVTTYAPSQNAVYDALALKLNTSATTTDVAEGTRLYFTDERVDDRVAALIQNGTGITWSYNDGSNTLTPTVTITQYTDEMAQDAIATLIQNGTGITWSYNDVSNTLTPTVTITQYTDALAKAAAVADAINNGTTDVAPSQNAVFDALALKFDQSNFIDEDSFASNSDTKAPSQQSVKAYVDAAIIGGGGYTDEQAQDAVGAMVDSTLVYVDGTPSLGRAAISGDITIPSGSNTAAIGTGVIVNEDVNASAAIALSKLAATTASRALVSDASGFVTAATTTATEIGYVNGVTSSIQTQINGKQASDATLTALAGLATGANKIPYSTGTDTFGQLDFVDEDNMASNSATAIPSQQSVKAYVDSKGGAGYTHATNSPFTSTSGANKTFTPSGGNDLVIEWSGVSANVTSRCLAIKPLFGGSTSATVDSLDTNGGTSTSLRTGVTSITPAGASTIALAAAETCSGKITIKDYQSTAGFKEFHGYIQEDSLGASADRQYLRGYIRNTSAINGILVEWTNTVNETAQGATSFDAGTITVTTRL